VLLYLPFLMLALHFNCASNALYGLTGGNSAFESFAFARSFVRINKVTGAASVLCRLASRCASLSRRMSSNRANVFGLHTTTWPLLTLTCSVSA
jgi:hypothetical protein